MSKRHISAKDLAFEQERMEWRQERREHERELKRMRLRIAELEREIEQRDDLLRSKDEWIERLLDDAVKGLAKRCRAMDCIETYV